MTAIRKAGKIQDSEDILAMVDKYGPKFKERFLEAIGKIKDQITLDEIEQMILSGNFDQAIVLTEQAALNLSGLWSAVYVDAGMESAAALSNTLGVEVNFDLVNHGAVDAMTETQLRYIREITEQQRQTIQQVLQNGLTRGLNPRETAMEIRNSIGLTQKQLQMIENYRNALENGSADALGRALRDRRFDPTVQAAVNGDTVLSDDQIDRMVERYSERWLNYRAEVISRTESLRAVNEGTSELYRQAIDRGDLEQDEIERTWVGTPDGRERPSHVAMNGQKRGVDEPFLSGDGNLLMQPGDINAPIEDTAQCRCSLTYRMN